MTKTKLVYITRKTHFNAAHRLYNPLFTDEENEVRFGKCANKNFHGHNFDLFVTIKGIADTQTGMVMDLRILKTVMQEYVVDKLDHKNINEDVDFMKGKMASTELLTIEIFNQLKAPIEANEGVFLHSVRLFETENNSAEYFGD